MNSEKTSVKAVMNSAAVNSAASKCGQTWTLSPGLALTSWIEPDLTTVSKRWVLPARPRHERRQRGGHAPAASCWAARGHARNSGRAAGLLAGFQQ